MNTLSEIEKPGSGTEPIHQEHVMCSRFRGSCPSDVKSAVHPEPGFGFAWMNGNLYRSLQCLEKGEHGFHCVSRIV
ncbi:Uncharacterised protein [uncultured Clostridium sp.]|nr:Uncharacterised protein [uncultured Clostridium sp.]